MVYRRRKSYYQVLQLSNTMKDSYISSQTFKYSVLPFVAKVLQQSNTVAE